MAKTVTVKLSEPLVTHAGALSAVVLREPTASEYWENGEPTRWAYNPEGIGFRVENDMAIKAYIESCLIEPADKLLLGQIKSLKDGMAIKKAVLDFFQAAQTAS